MKRKLAMLCAAVMGMTSVFGMIGCGGNGNEELVSEESGTGETSGKEETDGAKETGGEKVKLVFLRVGTEPERKAYWEKMVDGFMAENPDIEIEYQEAPAGDDFETKLNTGFASGTAPDVINFTLASMGTRVPLGQYASLDEYMDGWEGKEDFMESALSLGNINGTQYGIPVIADPRILIYNKEMFEEAGLDPESPPATWDELREAHKALIKKDGDTVVQTGLGIPTSGTNTQHWFSIFIEQNGVKNLVDDDNNTILCNTPEAIEAAEFMKELVDEGAVFWNADNADENPFASGKAAMTFANDTSFANWNTGDLEGKIAMADPISGTQQATFCGMSFMFMSGETEHKEEVWKFIEYVSSAESMWTRYEDLGSAVLRESLKEKYIAEDPEKHEAIYTSIACGTGSPKVAYANSVYNIIGQAMEQIMYDVAEPEKALNDAAEKIQEEIDNQ